MQEATIAIVSVFLSGFTTWFFARRKSLAEAKSQEIDNAKKNAEYYQGLVDDWVGRYKQVIEDLSRAVEAIKEKDRQIDEKDRQIDEKDRQINELMKSINTLTEELKKYKQLNGKT